MKIFFSTYNQQPNQQKSFKLFLLTHAINLLTTSVSMFLN